MIIIKIKVCFSWFSLDVIAAMLDNVNNRFLFSSFHLCHATWPPSCSCLLNLKGLLPNRIYNVFKGKFWDVARCIESIGTSETILALSNEVCLFSEIYDMFIHFHETESRNSAQGQVSYNVMFDNTIFQYEKFF